MKLFSSAYNAWPAGADAKRSFVSSLVKRDWVGGLELGYGDSISWPAGAGAALPALITGIPGTTAHHARQVDFGLASPDEGGRARAMKWAKKFAADTAELVGQGHQIVAVELHSAPTMKADAEVFAESLIELASLDWGGAQLWVEHCDAYLEGQSPQKGYLSLDEEIEVLDRVSAAVPEVSWGMVINWARSAIEGRNGDLPLEHVKKAVASGWLRHVGFSSCSGLETAWGEPWADQHLPLAGTSVAPEGTLLDRAGVTDIIEAAGDVTYGLKVALRPRDLPVKNIVDSLDENAQVIVAEAEAAR